MEKSDRNRCDFLKKSAIGLLGASMMNRIGQSFRIPPLSCHQILFNENRGHTLTF
jgi:hypothetical protein